MITNNNSIIVIFVTTLLALLPFAAANPVGLFAECTKSGCKKGLICVGESEDGFNVPCRESMVLESLIGEEEGDDGRFCICVRDEFDGPPTGSTCKTHEDCGDEEACIMDPTRPGEFSCVDCEVVGIQSLAQVTPLLQEKCPDQFGLVPTPDCSKKCVVLDHDEFSHGQWLRTQHLDKYGLKFVAKSKNGGYTNEHQVRVFDPLKSGEKNAELIELCLENDVKKALVIQEDREKEVVVYENGGKIMLDFVSPVGFNFVDILNVDEKVIITVFTIKGKKQMFIDKYEGAYQRVHIDEDNVQKVVIGFRGPGGIGAVGYCQGGYRCED